MEHGSYHKGLQGQKPRKVERSLQGRKKDRRTSLKEQRASPKKEREALRKEAGKQLRKPRCAIALIGSPLCLLPSSCLFLSLPVSARVGLHFGREVVTTLAPTFPDHHRQNGPNTLVFHSSSYCKGGSGCGRWPKHRVEIRSQDS